MSTVVQLRGLRLMCICGALPEEQERRQPYEFDIDVHADVTAATHDDVLDHTIDYGAVLDRIEAVARDESFQLFERLSRRIAEAILEDERIDAVTVEVRKLRPPVTQDLASSGMRLHVAR
ncbi:MAG: dihydroneopterin aldolase [Actinomycetota bacterium]